MSTAVASRLLRSTDRGIWSERVGVMFEAQFGDEAPFDISVESTHLGRVIVSDMRTSPFFFARRKKMLRTDMLDHFMLRVDATASETVLNVVDFGQELTDFAPIAPHNISIILPRDVMTEVVPDAETMHGRIVPDAGTELLKDFIKILSRHAPTLRQEQADGTATALVDLIGATLSRRPRALDRGRAAVVRAATLRAQQFIRARSFRSPARTRIHRRADRPLPLDALPALRTLRRGGRLHPGTAPGAGLPGARRQPGSAAHRHHRPWPRLCRRVAVLPQLPPALRPHPERGAPACPGRSGHRRGRGAGAERASLRRLVAGALERDEMSFAHHLALSLCLRMIFAENRFPLFGIML
nr:hypothetical protein [Jiella pelagia]